MNIQKELKDRICPMCGKHFIGKMVYCTLECLFKSKYKRGSYKLKREILDFMIKNTDISSRSIAKKFKVNKSVTERLALFTSRKFELKKVDEDFFHIINTEEKAYWLGFMFADGYVKSRNSNTSFVSELCLCSKDKTHLYKLKKCLKSNIEPQKKKCKCNNKEFEAYRFTVNRKTMYYDLVAKGCIENKSLKLKTPNKNIFKQKCLIRHFYRGYFDGDGCVGFYANKKFPNRKKSVVFNLLGTTNILENFWKYLDMCNIDYGNNSIYQGSGSKKNIFIISKTANKAKNVLNFLYSDCNIYLDRKYNKYLEIMKQK